MNFDDRKHIVIEDLSEDGYTGIDDARVEILANAIKMYDCYEVILISDLWRIFDPKA